MVASRDFSTTVGLSPKIIPLEFPAGGMSPHATRLAIVNAAAAGGGTIWLSRCGDAVPNAPGSEPLAPGERQVIAAPAHLPRNPLSICATAEGTPVTIELS